MAIFQKETPKAAPKAAGDETVPTQLIPYPVGSPPDPAAAYEEAHQDRFVDWSTTPPAAPPPEGGTRKGK